MNYKKGQELYSCYADEETGKIDLDIHIVRTVRGGFVYAIEKISGLTWGKKSKKHFDYGWLDPISRWYRQKTKQGERFPSLHTTKRQAYLDLKKEVVSCRYREFEPKIQKKILSAIKRRVSAIGNKKKQVKP